MEQNYGKSITDNYPEESTAEDNAIENTENHESESYNANPIQDEPYCRWLDDLGWI